MRGTIWIAALLATLLAGCGGGGDGGAGQPDLELTAVTVAGTVDAPAIVTVRDVPDQDAVVDEAFRVRLRLDGGAAADSLPRDPGEAGRSYDLPVVALGAGGPTEVPVTLVLDGE